MHLTFNIIIGGVIIVLANKLPMTYSLTLWSVSVMLSSLETALTLRNANATSVAIYTCKSSNCNSALVVVCITMRSPLNNFIAHKVVLMAKTSDEV